MCFEYDGYNEFSDNRVVRARKPHRCDECGGAIDPGQEYHYHTGKFDGEFFAYKVCRRCDYDRVRVAQREIDEGCREWEAWCPLGELRDYLHESRMGQTAPADVPESFKVGDRPVRRQEPQGV